MTRVAVEEDIAELVRLRALLFDNLGAAFSAPDADGGEWLEALARMLKEQLAADTMRVFVVDGDEGLAACGIGLITRSLPSPQRPNGLLGLVIGVVTDPAYRRRGHSRSVMESLLGWFQEREVDRVDLHASVDGEPLYRQLGFTDRPTRTLSWRP